MTGVIELDEAATSSRGKVAKLNSPIGKMPILFFQTWKFKKSICLIKSGLEHIKFLFGDFCQEKQQKLDVIRCSLFPKGERKGKRGEISYGPYLDN